MTNSWMNEAGEPIMDGAAWRFEQRLDMDSQADYMADRFYDNEPDFDYDECPECGGDVDPSTGACFADGLGADDDYEQPEDACLDSYWEDRLTTLYE